MERNAILENARQRNATIEKLSSQRGWSILLDRSSWHGFFASLHSEENRGHCQLKMLGAKPCEFGVTIFAEITIPLDDERYFVSCNLSLADTLSSLSDIWPHADWQEQEICELYGARISGIDRDNRHFVRRA